MADLFADRYEIIKELGRGAFGTVYLAHDTRLGQRSVALKVLHPALSTDPAVLRLFDNEAGTLANLQHDHIVPVYDAGVWEDRRYIAMAYVDGPSLAQVVKEQGAQSPEKVVIWLRQAADALAYAHGRGVLHRDIKSANLLLDRQRDRVFISDFGLARAAEVSGGSSYQGSVQTLTGTAAYRAPEVAKTGHTIASDLYSLGVVAYELLAGRLPFGADDPLSLMMLHATEPVPSLPGRVPSDLAGLVMRLLAKDPTERPANAEEVGRALSSKPESPGRVSDGEVAVGNRIGGWSSWLKALPRWTQAGGVLLLLVAFVLGASQLWPHTPPPSPTPPLIALMTTVPAPTPASVIASATPMPATATATREQPTAPAPTAAPTPVPPTATATSTATATPTSTPTATLTAMPTPTPAPAFAVKEGSAINVRSGPGMVYPVIGALQPGETRTVTGRTESSDWWQFDYNGRVGWVSGQVVMANTVAGNVVVAPIPPTPPGGVVIYPDKEWQDTGIYLTKGQYFEIGYLNGKWSECAAYGCPFYDANGASSNVYADNVMKDCYDARLIGRIAGAAPFCAGNRYFGVADVPGRLELRMNDAAIGDNAGGGSVTLEISTHQACRSLGVWNTTSALPTPIGHASAVAYDDRIYLIGGAGPTGGLRKTAYFASIRKDGELEAWREATQLPGSADYHASVVANGYLYVAGGSDGVGGSISTVLYTHIRDDGTLENWRTTTSLPQSLHGLKLVAYQGAVYLIGGSTPAQPRPQATVYRANIQNDGSLSGWTAVSSLPLATSWHEAVVNRNYLYVIGGHIGSGRTRQVYFATFGSDGKLEAWRETTSLPVELANHTAVVMADTIYVAGGLPNADISQKGVYSAATNPDGTLGAWQQVTALPQGLHDHSAAAVGRTMYIIGGFNTATGRYTDATYVASVQCD